MAESWRGFGLEFMRKSNYYYYYYFIRSSICTVIAFLHIPTPRFRFPPFLPFSLSFIVFPRGVPLLRMWPQPLFSMLYRICTKAQENCGNLSWYSWHFNRVCLSPVHSLWKNDLSLSVSICFLTCVTAWCRTPTTHRMLSVKNRIKKK